MIEKVLELIENKQFIELKKYLSTVNTADFPSIFEEVNDEDVIILFRLLDKEKASEVFAILDSDLQERLINSFTDTELKRVLDELYMDDTVDMIEEMPANVVKRILQSVNEKDRKIINQILKYPEDSAGSIMTTEFVDLKENMTVSDAFNKIRKTGVKKETVYNCYVVDMNRKLLGVVDTRDLLLSDQNENVMNLINTDIVEVNTHEDREEVAKMFDKYDCVAIPVVDAEKRLVGIVTVDDAIDVIAEETAEDFEKMAAMSPTEDSYFKTSVFQHAKNRIIWLLVLMVSSIFTGLIITHYENAFSAVPILVAFIPMLMDTGGNCGSQSSTLIIRGLATDEIKLKDFFRAAWKEFRVSILVGAVLAAFTAIRILIQYHDTKLALVVSLTIAGVVVIAKFLGCLLPMLAKKMKLDPAIMAAPLITTIVDTCSVLLFFNIAVLILNI